MFVAIKHSCRIRGVLFRFFIEPPVLLKEKHPIGPCRAAIGMKAQRFGSFAVGQPSSTSKRLRTIRISSCFIFFIALYFMPLLANINGLNMDAPRNRIKEVLEEKVSNRHGWRKNSERAFVLPTLMSATDTGRVAISCMLIRKID